MPFVRRVSFAVHIGDHLRSNLGIISALGIICGAVQSCLKPILDSFKMCFGSRDHYENQEVKRSLYRLQNVNNLPKDYIRIRLTCPSLAELFNFIGLVEIQEYIYSNL